WKKAFNHKVQQRVLDLQQRRMAQVRHQKEEEEKMNRRFPVDLLANEWFNENKLTVEARIYLLDKLLPTLIPGMEKLLREVESRDVLDAKEGTPSQFDPIHFLGQYLMRNNPQFDCGSQSSPYVRGLRQVLEKLKTEVLDIEENRLAKLKAEVKEKREQREHMQEIMAQVEETRKQALLHQFREWSPDTNGRIQLALIQSALRSFLQNDSPALALYDRELEPTDTLGQTVNSREFAEYVYSYVKSLHPEIFQEFLHHISQCSNAFLKAVRQDMWRQMFSDLFLACDHGQIGLLDRHRVLALLENFYDSNLEPVRATLCNPRQWPIIELDELDHTDFWVDFEDEERAATVTEDSDKPITPQDQSKAVSLTTKSLVTSGEVQPEASVTKKDVLVSEEKNRACNHQEVDGPEKARVYEPMLEIRIEETSTKHESAANEEERSVLGTVEEQQDGPVTTAVPKSEEDNPVLEDAAGEKLNRSYFIKKSTCYSSLWDQNFFSMITSIQQSLFLFLVKNPGQFLNDRPLGQAISFSLHNPPPPNAYSQIKTVKMLLCSSFPVVQESLSSILPTQSVWAAHVNIEFYITSSSIMSMPWTPHSIISHYPATPHERKKLKKKKKKGLKIGDLRSSGQGGRCSSTEDVMTQEEWSVAASRFTDLRSIISDIQSRGNSRLTSAFDGNSLNLPQFVQLLDTFVGEGASPSTVENLIEYLQSGYMETEEEKIERLTKACQAAIAAQHKLVLDALFETWDNDSAGFLELDEVETALLKYKEGMEKEILDKARERITSSHRYGTGGPGLTRKEFRSYIEWIVSELPGEKEEVFDNVVEFLTSSIKRSFTERARGSSRRKWLHKIRRAAETSGVNMDPVYKAVFQVLYKDAEAHGNNKKISCSIALLERNLQDPKRGDTCLRYTGCTAEDAPYLLNKVLYRDMKGVSFASIDEGKPVHVPRVRHHGNIHFWNPSRLEEDLKGSFLAVPLKDSQQRVYGILGVDTLREQVERNIFLMHEISFYQGVSEMFSIAYRHVQIRKNILRLVTSAMSWIHNRAPNITSASTYLMEPAVRKEAGYVLRKMMTTDNNTGVSEIHPSPITLRRADNIFRDYLFKCADNSKVITADAYGKRRIAVPLRDPSGRALGVIDVSTGCCRELPAHEFKDLQKMLKMLQAACHEMLQESSGQVEKTMVLEAEQFDEEKRVGILFQRFMLQDLRDCVQKLGLQSFAELKSYKDPPVMVHNILKAVLLLFNPEWAESEEIDSWNQCKLKVTSDLIRRVSCFDPTASSVRVHAELLAQYIKGIPRGAVWKHGSIPAEYLYNWAFLCYSLLEHKGGVQNESRSSSPSANPNPTLAKSEEK
uniref:EF-hand calcium binding domain 5 n=1 Tax=Latimeria chalumnae TaxID=7897 RepID=H3B4N1_LATCH